MKPNFRIGHGYDVHAFEPGEFIVLGGIKIMHHSSFKAHSDGDVLIHALCDALLGAAAMGDIGHHFPDTDPQFKGKNSAYFLHHVCDLLHAKRYDISNIDITIVAQKPKLAGHLHAMIENIASVCAIDHHQINIKATTTEYLGFTGREEGIAVHAVALIYSAKEGV